MSTFHYNFCKTVEKLIIKTIWITLYACAVTRKGPELLSQLSSHVKYLSLDNKGVRKFDEVSISYYGRGGRLRNAYDGAEAVDTPVRATKPMRRLPEPFRALSERWARGERRPVRRWSTRRLSDTPSRLMKPM